MLDGTHALVTGGGTGIGLAIARALAGAGAEVTIAGRRPEVLEAARAPGLHPEVMDVTREDSVRAALSRATAARGPVRICVANAGGAEPATLAGTTLAAWRATMAVNLDGAFLTIRECLPAMLETGWGRVVAISSMAGVRGMKRAPAYVAAKHGLTGLVRALATDHATAPVTFNALCPAYVETGQVPRNIATLMERDGLDAGAARAVVDAANPHNRLISPDEIAQAVLWLCGPHSGSVNGQAIQIAGGEF